MLANGSDSRGLSLTAQQVSPPTNASSFTLNSDGTFTYTPASNFNGTDTFTYQAANSLSNTSNVVTVTVTVTITVTLVNDAPVVTSDSISTAEDGTLTASVAGTISDVENNTVTVQLVSGPSNAASFNLSNDGSFTYVPTADFNSTDSFTYWATDSLGCNPVQVGWSHR